MLFKTKNKRRRQQIGSTQRHTETDQEVGRREVREKIERNKDLSVKKESQRHANRAGETAGTVSERQGKGKLKQGETVERKGVRDLFPEQWVRCGGDSGNGRQFFVPTRAGYPPHRQHAVPASQGTQASCRERPACMCILRDLRGPTCSTLIPRSSYTHWCPQPGATGSGWKDLELCPHNAHQSVHTQLKKTDLLTSYPINTQVHIAQEPTGWHTTWTRVYIDTQSHGQTAPHTHP